MEQVNVRWYVEDVSAHSASVVIAGLPGVGHVGKLVVDHLVRALSAVKVAEIRECLICWASAASIRWAVTVLEEWSNTRGYFQH